MAESAVLRRSFSNPSETSFQEGDPLRALGESISFGRYMSDSLAWEKWSTFSQNRYLEEAEKYSKPGSVAKMKAYFEAHYKRTGTRKQAAQEQANDVPTSVAPIVQDNVKDISPLNLEEEEANSHSFIHEFLTKDSPEVEVLPSVMVRSSGSSTEIKDLQNNVTHALETEISIEVTDGLVEVQPHQASINVSGNNTSEIEGNEYSVPPVSGIMSTPKRRAPFKEVEGENLELQSKQKSAISTLKKSAKSVSKLSSSLARFASPIPKKESIRTHKSRKTTKEPFDEKKRPPNFLHMSTMSEAKLPSSLAQSATPIRIKKETRTSKGRNSPEEQPEEKKPAPKLLHMSLNPEANPIKKSSRASHRTRMEKVFTPLGKIIKDRFTSSPAPSRASVSSVSQRTSATPQAETRRSRVALEKSFDQSRKLELKLQSPSLSNTKSSVQSASPTIFSSFNFRTEERAAKRREFFQKHMEKEAEKMQLLNKAKEVKAKTEVLNNSTKKILPRQTEFPKQRNKLVFDLAVGAGSRPPKRSTSSKLGEENTQLIPMQSNIPLTKKKNRENASPNIL